MKRMVFLIIGILVSSIQSIAQVTVINGLEYKLLEHDIAIVVGYSDKWDSRNLVVPSSVAVNGKTYSVIEIADSVFCHCNGLESVEISDGISWVGTCAFCECMNLRSVVIPGSVFSLNSRVFKDCGNLESVTLSEGVSHFDSECFANCVSLKSIHIPASALFFLSGDIFSGCDNLTGITVAEENECYDSRCDCNAIIETASNTLVVGCVATVVPNTVESIGKYAFARRLNLKSLNLPESVKSVGDYAFFGCLDLWDVIFEAGNRNVKEGKNVFGNCPKYHLIECQGLPIMFSYN